MGTKTKFYSSLMSSAPSLSNAAGSLINVLDAVLVNGFGTANVQSLVVAAGVATVTWAAPHTYVTDSVALFAGATPGGLNGEKRVTVTGANTVTFPAAGIPDGAATGAITSKVAALGWTKLYTGANLAVYKPTAPEATGCVLRVDDTGTTVARVRGYEAMSDVNTGTGLFPTLGQQAAPGLWWAKANTATARQWRIIGDDRGFYFAPKCSDTSEFTGVHYFGDLISLRGSDPYACVLEAHSGDRSSTSSTNEDLSCNDNSLTQPGCYVARLYSGLGGAVQGFTAFPSIVSTATLFSGSTSWPLYPSPVDNGLHVSQLMCLHSAALNTGPRGFFPGCYGSMQQASASMSTDDNVDGVAAMAGKRLKAVRIGATAPGAGSAVLFFDVLNDWR